jgi:hypothetical protein
MVGIPPAIANAVFHAVLVESPGRFVIPFRGTFRYITRLLSPF